MSAGATRSGALLAWLLGFAALAAVIGWETDWGRQPTRSPALPDVLPPAPVAVALLPEYKVEAGVDERRETVERPVFVPTRRPAPPPAPVVPEAAKPRMQKGQFVLTGTAVVDQKSIAFLRESTGGKSRTVRVGETINGVTVAEVKPDRVRLTLGDDSEELILKVAAGPKTTVQPAQAAAPPAAVAPPVPGAPARAVAPAAVAPGTPAAPGAAEASLLDRRRAARAAQAAAEAAARGETPTGQGAAPPAAPAAAQPPAGEPGWSDVYRRMQQRNPRT